MGWEVSLTPRPLSTPGKVPVPIVQEAEWAPGPVWTAENLAPLGFDPRRVQSVVSRYIDWATRPTVRVGYALLCLFMQNVALTRAVQNYFFLTALSNIFLKNEITL